MNIKRMDVCVFLNRGITNTGIVLAIHGKILTIGLLEHKGSIIPRSCINWNKNNNSPYFWNGITSIDCSRVIQVVGRIEVTRIPVIWEKLAESLTVYENKQDWLQTIESVRYGNAAKFPISSYKEEGGLNGSICWYDFSSNAIGDEERKIRPAVVLQDWKRECLIAPISSRKEMGNLPFHISIGKEDCIMNDDETKSIDGSIFLEQIRRVHKKDLMNCVGLVKRPIRKTLNRKLYLSIKGVGIPWVKAEYKVVKKSLIG